MRKLFVILCVIAALLLLTLIILEVRDAQMPQPEITTTQAAETTQPPTTEPPQTTEATEEIPTEPSTEPATEPVEVKPLFQPQKTESSDPANWNTDWDVIVGSEIQESYTREDPISFTDNDYFALPGVATFRGSNYRTDASYGTANITQFRIQKLWSMFVGYVYDPIWTGCGWTGQPLVVQWDAETKQHMNLYEEKQNKEGLVEVVYAKMDGKIHFFDMEDGTQTRDPINLRYTFKGSGALDPRGYPLLYVGSGLKDNDKTPKFFIISLIDGSVLYEFSAVDMTTLRWWFAFDSSPLVDVETDTLIWPCENGQLFTIKLNTVYDKENGTISVDPETPVKTRYSNKYLQQGRYIGYEASVTAVENYLYIGDNGGSFHCIDVNTMELVWAQDLTDDVNATAAFDWGEDGRGYLYVGASTDYSKTGEWPMYKLDAQTGEILWEMWFPCTANEAHVGGVMSSAVIGREGSNIENLLVFTVSDSPKPYNGVMYAVDKNTGEVIWELELGRYSWSSPLSIYTEDRTGYIFQADNDGRCYLIDGLTGKVLTTFDLKDHVEASPVAFGDRIMIGTRSGITLLQVT